MAEKKPLGSSKPSAGSPQSGEPAYLVIGKLLHPHGLRGEILMDIVTDFPERITLNTPVYIDEDHRLFRIKTVRNHAKGLLVSFHEYNTPEAVGELRNRFVYVTSANLPALAEGEYYHHQLLGLQVATDDGRLLGHLVEILDTSANDVYVVRPESGPDLLLPAIDPVIVSIDLAARRLTVHLLPGL